jgi:pimeloyl-ACP methyl ester carboxylesterase
MVLINGHNLYYESSGPEDAPALVLLHHGLGSTRAWKDQAPALAKAGYRLVVYDRWGYGRSDVRVNFSFPGFEDDLDDLKCLLAYLGIEQAGFIGHSDGGTIALYYAAQYPQRVLCLVTVAAHIYAELEMLPSMAGIIWAFEHDPHTQEGLRRAHGSKADALVRTWYENWLVPDVMSWDMRPLLRSITCPALVIQGDADEHAKAQHAADIAESIHGAELWLVPNVAHMVPQDAPDLFNARVIDFLKNTIGVVQ